MNRSKQTQFGYKVVCKNHDAKPAAVPATVKK